MTKYPMTKRQHVYNDSFLPRAFFVICSFGIRHSFVIGYFVIRHSSFFLHFGVFLERRFDAAFFLIAFVQ